MPPHSNRIEDKENSLTHSTVTTYYISNDSQRQAMDHSKATAICLHLIIYTWYTLTPILSLFNWKVLLLTFAFNFMAFMPCHSLKNSSWDAPHAFSAWCYPIHIQFWCLESQPWALLGPDKEPAGHSRRIYWL